MIFIPLLRREGGTRIRIPFPGNDGNQVRELNIICESKDMSLNGVKQLQKLRIMFCEFGGSSLGVRLLMKSPALVKFARDNPEMKIDFDKRNGRHPFVMGYYVNGYEHDVDLRKRTPKEILEVFQDLRGSQGRTSRTFTRWNSVKTARRSFQGKWNPVGVESRTESYP